MIEANNTDHFRYLLSRVQTLGIRFLPPYNPLDEYDRIEYDNFVSFILLCHAALEEYIENVSRETIKRATNFWKSHGDVAGPVLSVVVHYDKKYSPPPEEISFATRKKYKENGMLTTEQRIATAIGDYEKKLDQNNGIKTKDTLAILMPIGLEHFEYDSTVLKSLDDLGSYRGANAHKTKGRITVQKSPSQWISEIEGILKHLHALDVKIHETIM